MGDRRVFLGLFEPERAAAGDCLGSAIVLNAIIFNLNLHTQLPVVNGQEVVAAVASHPCVRLERSNFCLNVAQCLGWCNLHCIYCQLYHCGRAFMSYFAIDLLQVVEVDETSFC
ncbi:MULTISPECIES: hypothetical protein [unclassified Microcoleus]|uniref:hypothetical protein n=1 Tax=unclassified Microcoleus TaxID=2642155 RepID=UPI002FD1FA60